MNLGGGQIRGALFNFFVVKKCPFCIFRTLSSVSTITPVIYTLKHQKLMITRHKHVKKSILNIHLQIGLNMLN